MRTARLSRFRRGMLRRPMLQAVPCRPARRLLSGCSYSRCALGSHAWWPDKLGAHEAAARWKMAPDAACVASVGNLDSTGPARDRLLGCGLRQAGRRARAHRGGAERDALAGPPDAGSGEARAPMGRVGAGGLAVRRARPTRVGRRVSGGARRLLHRPVEPGPPHGADGALWLHGAGGCDDDRVGDRTECGAVCCCGGVLLLRQASAGADRGCNGGSGAERA